jgi:hypothetical protein
MPTKIYINYLNKDNDIYKSLLSKSNTLEQALQKIKSSKPVILQESSTTIKINIPEDFELSQSLYKLDNLQPLSIAKELKRKNTFLLVSLDTNYDTNYDTTSKYFNNCQYMMCNSELYDSSKFKKVFNLKTKKDELVNIDTPTITVQNKSILESQAKYLKKYKDTTNYYIDKPYFDGGYEYNPDYSLASSYHGKRYYSNKRSKKLNFGVEIETVVKKLPLIKDYYNNQKLNKKYSFVCENDGSIGHQNGIELVSDIIPYEARKLFFKKTQAFVFDKLGASTEERSECGGHITISTPLLSSDEICHQIGAYSSLLAGMYPSRVTGQYSKMSYLITPTKYNWLKKRDDEQVEIRLFPMITSVATLQWRIDLIKFILFSSPTNIFKHLRKIYTQESLQKTLEKGKNTSASLTMLVEHPDTLVKNLGNLQKLTQLNNKNKSNLTD